MNMPGRVDGYLVTAGVVRVVAALLISCSTAIAQAPDRVPIGVELSKEDKLRYREEADERAEAIDQQVERLQGERNKASSHVRRQISSYLTTLEHQRGQLARELRSLGGTSEERWRQQVSEVEAVFTDIKKTFAKLSRDLKKASYGVTFRSQTTLEYKVDAIDTRLSVVETNMNAKLDAIYMLLQTMSGESSPPGENNEDVTQEVERP